jgi:hypothetical protein
VYLNAWGIARTLLTDAPEWFSDGRRFNRLLSGGDFAGSHVCSGFTECHWSTPDDACKEIEEAGFVILEEAGAEGFAGGLSKEITSIAEDDPAAFEHIISFGVQTSRMPQYRRATDHYLIVSKAP